MCLRIPSEVKKPIKSTSRNAKQTWRQDGGTEEAQEDRSWYEVIGDFFSAESRQALAISVKTFLQLPAAHSLFKNKKNR